MPRYWVILLFTTPHFSQAQEPCRDGVRVEGVVTDLSGALIPGANVRANAASVTSGPTGQFVLTCVPVGSTVEAVATGFGTASARVDGSLGSTAHLSIRLSVGDVQSSVQVDADAPTLDDTNGAGTLVLGAKEIEQLPDDPDDLVAQLQSMAANGGGNPATSTLIAVDGFQNGSALPPKSAIASIRINPDVFAAEYESPQIHGGRVEITTKPGADAFHGAFFYTNSNPIFNAKDPLSVSSTPAGKHRYGFELTGPIGRGKTDFSAALEKRDIDEFAIVNAITFDGSFNPVPLNQTVPTPQRLWIGSVRGDWQATPKDTVSLSYSANVNSRGNQGVGGLTLAEAGYSSLVNEYDLRFHNTQTVSGNLLHETRIGYTWKRMAYTPNSTAPSLQVSGDFTGGGAVTQGLNTRERDLEIDDDLLLARGAHSIKMGLQSLGVFEHNYTPNAFNGAYTFGGGSGPVLDANNNPTGATTTITAAQQYQRALLSLPGGNPTTYLITTGNPLVSFAQWNIGLFIQDAIKLNPRLMLDGGLRYQLQTNPATYGNMQARLGLSFSPDKKQSWVIHLRAGLFSSSTSLALLTDIDRLGTGRQQQRLIYSPDYASPLTAVAGSVAISTVYSASPQLRSTPGFRTRAGIEHEFAHHWRWSSDFNSVSEWQLTRKININAPQVESSVGVPADPISALSAPRPITPSVNIFQYQNNGHYRGWWFASSLDQHDLKWLNSKITYWYVSFQQNPETPQSTYSTSGDSARPDWMARDGLSINEVLTLPRGIILSSYFDWLPGIPFNITTGTDGNGDGTFNDRPSFATAPGTGIYSTRWGLMTTNTVNGNVPYNLGRMPSITHFSANLSKAFRLQSAKRENPRLLTLNLRAGNVLNRTRVTAVGTVVSSPNFSQPLTAEDGRRLELGARFSF
ncbi:TonB-dependent receptor [Terriglobus roseus]|uniref:Carboxypeptidase regulatory-like domain-containing protein n=1 Tax=Terriglobus roseus TaxID=392734 RepID=A0A1G7HET6_9BACT|nr:carboxypeptidase regulatory-like domain-containing protein [Terriglobus roseus]SDE98813.1 Carboxypeptidase regulatory-like domain-containing protein [Terriglobus roseus]